jgi:uncharacterized protein YraI
VAEITGKSVDNAWWQVRVPNTIAADGFGWVSASYVYAINAENVPVVSPPSSAPVITPMPPVATSPSGGNTGGTTGGQVRIGTTTDVVNIREGPGNQYDSLGVLPAGATGVIIDQTSDGKFYAFKVSTSIAPDGKGWVSAAYVKVTVVNSATATAMATPLPVTAKTATPGPNATSKPPVTNACKINDLKPADGTTYKPNNEFDMKVTVTNTSNTDWDPNAIDVIFVSALNNIELHTSPSSFDLPNLVKPGEQITLPVDMKAPAQNGTYGETWAIVSGNNTLCGWSFTIKVVK